MKILLATDGSDYNKLAIKEFIDTLSFPQTEVRIISAYQHVSTIMTTGVTIGVLESYYEEANKSAKKSAEDAVKFVADQLQKKHPSIIITTAVVNGPSKKVILQEAEEYGADLIVVGSHGRGGLERFLLGSVSQAVALHAKCSVQIIRHRSA